MGEAVAAATEEGTQLMVLRETQLKRYNPKRSESVGADISRPKGNESERIDEVGVLTIQRALSEEPRAVGPLQSVLSVPKSRQDCQLPPREALAAAEAAPIEWGAIKVATLWAAGIRPYGVYPI